jgi:large subunit ribosomal protein L18
MSNKSDAKRSKIKKRIRRIVFGSQERPRLSVFRSNKEIYAQVINDVDQKTLVAASSKDKDLKIETTDRLEISKLVGMSVAKKAIEAGIKSVSFDRNGYIYHGRIKSLAEGAREAGLKF